MPGPCTDAVDLLQLLVEERLAHALIVLDPDGVVLTWNAGAQRVTGYRREEAIGQSAAWLYAAADLERGAAEHALAIASAAGSYTDEGRRVRQDGTSFWAEETTTALRGPDGRLLGFGRTIADITERKRRDDAGVDDGERLRLLVDGVRDQALISLTPTGFVASWNAGAECLTGYRPADILGQHFSRFYNADDLLNGVPEEQLEEADVGGLVEVEGWRVRKDGTPFWSSVTLSALMSADGTVRGYGLIMRDLTSRKRAEDALRSVLRRERETAQRLRDLDAMRDDFESLVTRNLRTPLQVLDSVSSTLLTKWNDLDEPHRRELLDRVGLAATNLTELVDDVLRRARLESGEIGLEPGPLDVVTLLNRAADAQPPDVAAPPVHVDTPTDLPLAYGDEHRTWQVLMNLLSNARRFSPAGAAIVVGAGVAGEVVRVYVRDRGPGVAPDARRRIFERFTRLHPDDGTGLGLFIARTMVEAQGGQIGVDSEPGHGSEFWFTLPRHGGTEVLDVD